MRIKLLSFKKIWPMPDLSLSNLFKHAYRHEAACTNPVSVIRTMAADYINDDIADETHLKDMLYRESLDSFALTSDTVFIFTIIPSKKTQLSVLTLTRRIRWNDFSIHQAVMGMFGEGDRNLLFHLKILINESPSVSF